MLLCAYLKLETLSPYVAVVTTLQRKWKMLQYRRDSVVLFKIFTIISFSSEYCDS